MSEAAKEAEELLPISICSDNTSDTTTLRTSATVSPDPHSNPTLTPLPPRYSFFKGNSDPFGCFPIEITPQVNQAIGFMRDTYFPILYNQNKLISTVFGADFWGSKNIEMVAWQATCECFQVEGAALACIASLLGTISTLASGAGRANAARLSLILSTKSSSLLRNALGNSTEDSHPTGKSTTSRILFDQIHFLHHGSMIRGDENSIKVYGPILHAVLVRLVNEGTLDLIMFCQASVDDIDASARFICRTSIDYGWFAQTCSGLWDTVEAKLPKLPPSVSGSLHENVLCVELRQVFQIARRMSAYGERKLSPSIMGNDTVQKRLIFTWFATNTCWAVATAMNLALDLRDDKYAKCDFTVGRGLTQAALALALVFLLRDMGHGNIINGVDVRDFSAYIMPELHIITKRAFATCTNHELQELAEAHLWILFMGAFCEQRRHISSTEDPGWFQEQLVNRALLDKKANWARLKPVLQKFVYADWEEPNGSEWFDDLVQDQVMRDRQALQAEILRAKMCQAGYQTPD